MAADVAIRDGRIAAIGALGNAAAARTIDAAGLVVAPGFIDLHTHSDLPLVADGTAQSKVRQGVTLDVTGEISSVAPRDGLTVTRFESGGPAHPDEVIEMAKVVARHGGNYTSHIGSEGFEQTKEIATLRGDADPMDTAITLMAEEGGNINGIFHTMSEADVRKVMRLPWVAVASDGSAINLDAVGVPHPRNYSTNARVLGHYVRGEKVLTLPDAVRKMTALPAEILGLKDRGQLKAGFVADVVVFDPARVAETNSFEKPKSYATGVPFVLVNGVLVVDKGEHTGARPGKPLRGTGATGTASAKSAR